MTNGTHIRGLVAAGLLASSPATALGAGGKANIEEGLPLTIESPYTIEKGGREVQLVTRYERTDEGEDDLLFEPRLEFGVWWNTELSVAAPFHFGSVPEDGLGPVNLELTYNLNQETLDLPAISFAGGLDFPTGDDAEGYDPFAKVLVSRTLGRSSYFHQAHFNLEYQWNDDVGATERAGRYTLALGYSARLNTDTLFLADVVREQEWEENVEMNLAEAGLRYQLLPQGVLSSGVGFGFGDESPDVRLTVGFQYEF